MRSRTGPEEYGCWVPTIYPRLPHNSIPNIPMSHNNTYIPWYCINNGNVTCVSMHSLLVINEHLSTTSASYMWPMISLHSLPTLRMKCRSPNHLPPPHPPHPRHPLLLQPITFRIKIRYISPIVVPIVTMRTNLPEKFVPIYVLKINIHKPRVRIQIRKSLVILEIIL